MTLDIYDVGNVDITTDTIDVTDPCYDKDVWCRINDLCIEKGNYQCLVALGSKNQDIDKMKSDYEKWANEYYKTFEEYKDEVIKDATNRIFRIIMYLNDAKNPIDLSKEKWEPIGDIGVDAGLAGFIWNQSIYNPSDDKSWDSLIKRIYEDEADNYTTDDNETIPHMFHIWPEYGFFSSSGYGDGVYDVSVIKRDDKIIALKIDF